MASTPTVNQLFSRPRDYPVIICQQCEYAVRPKQVVYHLTHSPHRTPIAVARQVAQSIEEWDEVEEDPDQLWFPTAINKPIEGLTTYQDGILCTQSAHYGYVCRNVKAMKIHWRQEHGWSIYQQSGRPIAQETQASVTG